MERTIFFGNIGKAEREAEGCHSDNSKFYFDASLLVCYLFLRCFFPLSLRSFVRFLLLLHRDTFSMDETPYYITCLFVFAFICSRRSLVWSLLRWWSEILKATEIGLLRCKAINSYGATVK